MLNPGICELQDVSPQIIAFAMLFASSQSLASPEPVIGADESQPITRPSKPTGCEQLHH